MKEFNVKQVIVIRKDLNMRKGKIGSQTAHASLASVLDQMIKVDHPYDGKTIQQMRILCLNPDSPMYEWLNGSFAKIVVYVNSEAELTDLMVKGKEQGIQVTPIIDAGNTEFHGVPTLTCAAFGPEFTEKINKLTGHLPLI